MRCHGQASSQLNAMFWFAPRDTGDFSTGQSAGLVWRVPLDGAVISTTRIYLAQLPVKIP
jgi:hypothetical protein